MQNIQCRSGENVAHSMVEKMEGILELEARQLEDLQIRANK